MTPTTMELARMALTEGEGRVPAERRIHLAPDSYGRAGKGVQVAHGDVSAMRAVLLAIMHRTSPHHLVRCHLCALFCLERDIPPCTPVRDVLAGHTCGAKKP